MKKITTLAILIAAIQVAIAQTPQGMNYQAVARNSSGNVLVNTFISLRLTVQDGNNPGTPDYQETDTVTTNQFGLFTIVIGNGTVTSGTFAGINWSTGNKYLRVELDPTGGSNYVIMGTSALQSVPYALFAGNGGVGTGWNLSGNTGTTYGTSFIGNLDNQNLMFKIDDTIAGRIENYPGANTSFGFEALFSNTGTFNTAVGLHALFLNTSGIKNTSVGEDALRNNVAGEYNTAMGFSALEMDSSGSYNTAIGLGALELNTGSNNTALGYAALNTSTSGTFNTAIGIDAIKLNTTGNNNSALGSDAMRNNTTGYSNVGIGMDALYSNQTLSGEVAIGDSALYNVTADTGANTAIGSKSLFANTTGSYNTASGFEALTNNVSGYNNTASGAFALKANTTGGGNSAFGELALSANISGGANSAFGRLALSSSASGTGNSAFGFQSLTSNTLGEDNTATGGEALAHTTTGFNNTAVGYQTLYSNTTGNFNTSLGCLSDVGFDTLNNATAIGYGAISNANNKVVIGNTNVTSIGGQVGWTNYSDERVKTNIEQNVPGLAFIKLLQPVTYNYDINKENELLGSKNIVALNKGKQDIESITFSGFLAQQVDVAAKNSGYNFSGVDKRGSLWGLRYSEFVPSIVKSVQEIDNKVEEQKQAEQSIILKLQQQIEAMQKEIDALKNK